MWDGISNPGDGHRLSGEVGIYPLSCFDITKPTGVNEYTEVDGYYITAHYAPDSGTTTEEGDELLAAYVMVSFTCN
jgi:hypothetical protein